MHNSMSGQNTIGELRSQRHNGITWLDVQEPTVEILSKLEHDYHLHPVHLKESVQKVQHNQVEREEDYLFLVMHYPVRDTHKDRLTFGQLGIFLGKNYLITIRTARYHPISAFFDDCQHHPQKAEATFQHGVGYVLYLVICRVLDDMSRMTDEVVSELDEIEDQVFDNNDSDAQRIGKVRQKIVRLMRIIGPKRILLQDLAEQINDFSGQHLSRYYSNNTKTANKLWETIEEAKETVEIYKDADFTTSTEKTNQVLTVLTIIFTLTIPVTVAGTLYGMNIPLPGSLTAHVWTFFGPYTTGIILVLLSLVAAFAMYAYFRLKKWF